MAELGTSEFVSFFEAAWGRKPFGWQVELARKVLAASIEDDGAWPEAIALPTASGKTACMDVAIFTLAARAESIANSPVRKLPRRIFFVIDRRVIVDEAYERSLKLASVLAEADEGILRQVADRLRALAGTDTPLAVQSLRGGQPRRDDWAATPLQPTVVTSTVDQVGSRLLFRGYGPSPGMWPIHAGLIGNDSLILLDEAHCAQPMLQTLRAVRRYRTWAERPLDVPFEVTVLSATPPPEAVTIFRDESGEGSDPAHPLGRRQLASKPARLVIVDKAKGGSAATRRTEMAATLVREAMGLIGRWNTERAGAPAVVVFCNRVDTARRVDRLLRDHDVGDVCLLTGRMRAIDKDLVIGQALAPLSAGKAEGRRLARPMFAVATQTLEVGADLDFDLLVTECASLDALRQRFGRLNRSGRAIRADAVIAASAYDAIGAEDDPVYGSAIRATWSWMQKEADKEARIDFGVSALEARLPVGADLQDLNAPSPQAPVMLPSHLDLLAQTAPVPEPSPDPSVFLHGPDSGPADVQMCWRNDLTLENRESWIDAVVRCPPSSPECLPVPFLQARKWLDGVTSDGGADIEGTGEADDRHGQVPSDDARKRRVALRWRGRDGSEEVEGGDQLRPGDVLVLPGSKGGLDELATLDPAAVVDWGDRAHAAMHRDAVLRLHPDVISKWPGDAARAGLDELLTPDGLQQWDEDPSAFGAELREALKSWEGALDDPRWSWLQELVSSAAKLPRLDRAVVTGPCGGLILLFHRTNRPSEHVAQGTSSFFGDEDDAASSGHFRSLLIEAPPGGLSHLQGVGALAHHYALQCGLPEEVAEAYRKTGEGHDIGKADPRFQAWLRNGVPWVMGPLLAKSEELPQGLRENADARKRAGYPEGGRHELLSVRLLESCDEALPVAGDLRDLALHLVESHHGYCRPLAPTVTDPSPVDVTLAIGDMTFSANSLTKLERIDAGPADRFWRLTRRYGWWGLAWLESLLRLADHRRSEWEHGQASRSKR